MRITGGRARGIPLDVPRGDSVRPATDRMREAVFSRLAGEIESADFLDLFAGSGSYGLEAISRGAVAGTFVEKHAGSARLLKQNLKNVLKSCSLDETPFKVVTGNALRFDHPSGADLIFADPPYAISAQVLPDLLRQFDRLLKPAGLVVLELPSELNIPQNRWEVLREWGKKGRGQPSVRLLQRRHSEP